MIRATSSLLAAFIIIPNHLDCQAFGGLDLPQPRTTRAVFKYAASQGRSDPLPRHFNQPEGADPEHFGACAIATHGVAHDPFHRPTVAIFSHVDESLTMTPPRSRRRICREISSAAFMLTW